MRLTENDKNFLIEIGVDKQDFDQMQRAIGKTVYTLCTPDGEMKISREKAIELLGRETWLTGIYRSAFHFTAVRDCKYKKNDFVHFNSSKLFKS